MVELSRFTIHHYPNGPADNPPLRRLLESKRLACRSLYPTKGTWVSVKLLFECQETRQLQEFILSCLPPGDWQLQGWGVVMEAGANMGRHDHRFPGNVWSGVYYPADGGGEIQFDGGKSYQPEESSLIVFAASEPHEVKATGRRYSIAFNARGVAVSPTDEPCDRCGKMNHPDDLQPYNGTVSGASEHGRYCHDCLGEFRMEE